MTKGLHTRCANIRVCHLASNCSTSIIICEQIKLALFVCLSIATVPACSSGTLTNMMPHRNAMPQTQDTTLHPVTVYSHGAYLSLCYPVMWNVTLEYTAIHFNVMGQTRPGNPSPDLPHTPANAQLYDSDMVVSSWHCMLIHPV